MRQTNRLQLSFCLRLKGTPFTNPPLAVWAYNGGRQVLSYDVGSDGTSKQPSTAERTSDTGKVGAFTVWVYDHHTSCTCRHRHIYTNRSNAPNANTNSPTMALFSGMLFRLHSTCLTLPQPAKQEWWSSHERSALGHHLPESTSSASDEVIWHRCKSICATIAIHKQADLTIRATRFLHLWLEEEGRPVLLLSIPLNSVWRAHARLAQRRKFVWMVPIWSSG